LQSRVGAVQNKTTQELADSTKKYLVEQDALTKLTGMTRQDQEKSREEIRSQERFAAKLEEVRSTRGEAAAKALEDTYLILKSKSREAAQGFADLSTGMITTEAARKQNMSDQGESIRQSQAIVAGLQTAAGGAQEIAKVSGATAKAYGTSLALMGVNNNVMSDYAGGLALGAAAAGDGIAKAAEKVKKDQEKQAAGADKITDQQSELVLKQMEANKEMEQFIFKQIPNAQKHMIDLADAAGAAARALNRAFPDKKEDADKNVEARRKAVEDAKIGGMMSDTMLNDMGMDFGNLSGADGGVFKGPESGYPVLMHGTEAIVPMDKLSGASKMSDLDQMMGLNKLASAATNNQQSVDNPDADKMEKFVKSMLKDTESLTKITDTDLNRTKNFSLLQTKLFEKKTALMEDELELLDEQNEILEQMLEIAEKAGGKEAAAAMKKSFTMARMGMSGGGMGGGMTGGGGLQMPSSPGTGGGGTSNLSATGGGQGLKASSTDLLQFGGASGSASNFEGLDDRLETAVLNAASEYNSLTGNKLKINSAKRDPEDQVRLYQETVDAGRPGIGPSGMPVGRPGTSSHEKGLAVDIQNYNDPAALKALNGQGLHQLIPKDPVHFQLSGETGMIADGPESGYQATLHGKEAVIPMQNNSGDFVKMFEAMAEGNSRMVAMMEQMVSAQKNSVDVQTKMLRAQS
jgi:hypothetical protein